MLPDLAPLGLAVKRLELADQTSVTEFCRRCSNFFELVEGVFDPERISVELLTAAPPGVDSTNKYVLGLERERKLIGLVDLIDGFPAGGDWYVGILLLLPEERGRGVGRATWTVLEDWIDARGGRAVRLVVQDQNPRAARFWDSRGFAIEAVVQQVLETRTNQASRLVKLLRHGAAEPGVADGRGPRLRSEPRR